MRKIILALSIGGVLFCSCIKEPVVAEAEKNVGAVTFRASSLPTRATETSFENGDAISIFASDEYDGSLDSRNYADNSEYVYSSGEFRPYSSDDIVSYPDEYTSLNFYAVWPYSTSYSGSEFDFSVNLDQTSPSAYAASNLMVARTEATREASVDLNFDHLMCKVIINIKSSNYPTGDWLSLFNNVYTDATINLNDGSVFATGTQGYVLGSMNGNKSFKVLLPPQTIPAGTQFLVFQIGEESWQWKPSQAIILASGVEYEYTLTI